MLRSAKGPDHTPPKVCTSARRPVYLDERCRSVSAEADLSAGTQDMPCRWISPARHRAPEPNGGLLLVGPGSPDDAELRAGPGTTAPGQLLVGQGEVLDRIAMRPPIVFLRYRCVPTPARSAPGSGLEAMMSSLPQFRSELWEPT